MKSNQQIISDLRVIMEAEQNLELLCTHKGVPFVCKAKVIHIDDDIVRLKTLDASMICLLQDSQAKVLGSDYFEPASAHVEQVDLKASTVDLTGFSYIGTKLGERMIVRVEPKEPMMVQVENAGMTTIAELADISISGIGLRIAHADFNSMLKPGATVQLNLNLNGKEIIVSGTILSAVKTAEQYRISVRFDPDGIQRSLIFKYLIDRRAEIEQEVFDQYRAMVGSR
jgi:hypothetical protein